MNFLNRHNSGQTKTAHTIRARWTWLSALWFLFTSCSYLTAQTVWHWSHPLPSQGSLFAVTYGSGHFVAVGDLGTVLTSPDAATWTSSFPQHDTNLRDVAYGNETFVMVGEPTAEERFGNLLTSAILTSTDGTTWTETAPIPGHYILRLVFTNDLFIGFGGNEWEGVPVIVTSPDGVTWTERWRGKESSSWSPGYDFPGREVAVAVGNGTIVVNAAPTTDNCAPQSFLVSTNSLDWAEVSIVQLNGCIQSLHLNFGLGKFLAVAVADDPFAGGRPNHKVLMSGDGFTWEAISEDWDTSDDYLDGALGFGNGSFLVLSSGLTNGSSAIALTSTNGRTWTEHFVAGLDVGTWGGQEHTISRLIYAQNLFVIVGQPQRGQYNFNDYPYIFTSPDGLNWSRRFGATISGLGGVAANDRRVVTLGTVGSDAVILASRDGRDWQQTQRWSGPPFWSSIISGSGRFVVAGDSGILTSPDGDNWSIQTNAGTGWSYLRSGMNRILALGGESSADGKFHYKLGISSDGLAWATQRLDNVSCARDVATDGQSVVLIGNENASDCNLGPWSIWLWTNGVIWTQVHRELTTPCPAFVAFGNGRYLIPEGPYNTTGPAVLTSNDGVNWTKQIPILERGPGDLIFEGISSLIFAHGNFYATDYAYDIPEVLSSADGLRWKAHPTDFQALSGLAAGPQGLFALNGFLGGILYSPWDLVLTTPDRGPDGAFRIWLTGPSGANVQVQRASTLNDWVDWRTVTLGDSPVLVEDPDVSASSRRFYRGVLLP
jgi:hypothetical protein